MINNCCFTGVGFWRGVSPAQYRWGLGKGCAPRKIFSNFSLEMVYFGAFDVFLKVQMKLILVSPTFFHFPWLFPERFGIPWLFQVNSHLYIIMIISQLHSLTSASLTLGYALLLLNLTLSFYIFVYLCSYCHLNCYYTAPPIHT